MTVEGMGLVLRAAAALETPHRDEWGARSFRRNQLGTIQSVRIPSAWQIGF